MKRAFTKEFSNLHSVNEMRVPSDKLKTDYFRMKRVTKIQTFAAFLLLLFTTSSCLDELFIEGNGIPRTESRDEEGFDKVASSGDFKVNIVPGNYYSVEITAESNLLPYISTQVDGHKLKIGTTGIHSLRQNLPIEVNITTPALKGVSLSGSGLIQTGSIAGSDFDFNVSGSGDIVSTISCDNVSANISGSGSVTIDGEAENTSFVISGSGKIKTYNLVHDQCIATISGSGDMYVNASQSIEARISGSGKVYYVNHPAIYTSISGSGGVVNKN